MEGLSFWKRLLKGTPANKDLWLEVRVRGLSRKPVNNSLTATVIQEREDRQRTSNDQKHLRTIDQQWSVGKSRAEQDRERLRERLKSACNHSAIRAKRFNWFAIVLTKPRRGLYFGQISRTEWGNAGLVVGVSAATRLPHEVPKTRLKVRWCGLMTRIWSYNEWIILQWKWSFCSSLLFDRPMYAQVLMYTLRAWVSLSRCGHIHHSRATFVVTHAH